MVSALSYLVGEVEVLVYSVSLCLEDGGVVGEEDCDPIQHRSDERLFCFEEAMSQKARDLHFEDLLWVDDSVLDDLSKEDYREGVVLCVEGDLVDKIEEDLLRAEKSAKLNGCLELFVLLRVDGGELEGSPDIVRDVTKYEKSEVDDRLMRGEVLENASDHRSEDAFFEQRTE